MFNHTNENGTAESASGNEPLSPQLRELYKEFLGGEPSDDQIRAVRSSMTELLWLLMKIDSQVEDARHTTSEDDHD